MLERRPAAAILPHPFLGRGESRKVVGKDRRTLCVAERLTLRRGAGEHETHRASGSGDLFGLFGSPRAPFLDKSDPFPGKRMPFVGLSGPRKLPLDGHGLEVDGHGLPRTVNLGSPGAQSWGGEEKGAIASVSKK